MDRIRNKRFTESVQHSFPILIVVALTVLFFGCSKEKRTERRLEKVHSWNIDKIDYQKVQTGTGATVKVGTENNAGSMVFNKDGSGNYDYMLDGQRRTGSFTWTTAVNNLTFSYVSATTTLVQVVSYTILHENSKAMTIQGSEVIVDPGGQLVLNATFYISK